MNSKRLDCSAHFKDWNNDFFQKNGLLKLKKNIRKLGIYFQKRVPLFG
jgi:ribosomal protein S15P/S13E